MRYADLSPKWQQREVRRLDSALRGKALENTRIRAKKFAMGVDIAVGMGDTWRGS
jgi:hypothetical protein